MVINKDSGFIIDRTYRIVDSKPKVYLFGRLENGESFLTINDCKPYFYIRTNDREAAEKLVNFPSIEDTKLSTFSDELVTRVFVSEPKIIPDVRRILEMQKIPCFEADIQFTQQFVMDHNILSTLQITGEYKQGTNASVQRIYENPTLSFCDKNIPLRTLALDLEASSADNGDLYCVSLVGKTFLGKGPSINEVIFLSNKQTHNGKKAEALLDLDAIIVPDEKTLLLKLNELILAYDPDVITGWNVIDFDLAFLKEKYEKHKVDFVWGRVDWPNRIRIESSFQKDSKAEVAGRMVLDGIHLLKSSFINLDDYKLGTAAHEILGEEKLIEGKNKMQDIIDAYHDDPKKLVAYNRKDSQLVLDILDKKELMQLTVLRSSIVGLPLERVKASIASLDSLYIRELHAMNKVAPSGTFVEKEEGITGGYVKTSLAGIYDWVIVLDFKSLYPSVMRTFNIDPLDHRPACKARNEEALIHAPNGTCFVNGEGILPRLLKRVWDERDEAKKRKNATASFAFKILMNSFFGVMASPNCRFFSMELANAITHFAQHVIKHTIERLESQGYSVIYGDTDSVFLNLDVKNYDDAKKIGLAIQKDTNAHLREYVKKEYSRESFLELQFEKTYKKFLMPRVRGSDEGSKKRYAGLLVYDDAAKNERMDFTGLEFVRRDWTELAKEFQLTLLDRIFHEQAVESYVKQFVDDLKSGKHDALLIYRKAIRKDLEKYTKTTPPHVKAARKILDKGGKITSNIIEYVMTANGPEPLGYESASLDYDHYVEKQIRPIADSVLCFFDTNLDDLMKGSSQKTLFGF